MFRGYIKLWRKIEDNPLSHDSDFMAIWVWILLLANHKFKEWKIGYQKIPIKRGQFITSRKKLSHITGVNESKLERTMTYLQSEQQIEQQKHNNYRLIIVKNYDKYQPFEQRNEQQTNSKRTASEQQVNTTNNDNNVKNEKTPIAANAAELNEPEYLLEEDGISNKQIIGIFYIFKKINPLINFNNKTQRQAVKEIIKEFTYEKAKSMAQYAISIQGQKYAPVISTPYMLKSKIGDLRSYYHRQNDKNKTINLDNI